MEDRWTSSVRIPVDIKDVTNIPHTRNSKLNTAAVLVHKIVLLKSRQQYPLLLNQKHLKGWYATHGGSCPTRPNPASVPVSNGSRWFSASDPVPHTILEWVNGGSNRVGGVPSRCIGRSLSRGSRDSTPSMRESGEIPVVTCRGAKCKYYT